MPPSKPVRATERGRFSVFSPPNSGGFVPRYVLLALTRCTTSYAVSGVRSASRPARADLGETAPRPHGTAPHASPADSFGRSHGSLPQSSTGRLAMLAVRAAQKRAAFLASRNAERSVRARSPHGSRAPRAPLARHELLACRSRSFAPARFHGPALATLACAAQGSPARAPHESNRSSWRLPTPAPRPRSRSPPARR